MIPSQLYLQVVQDDDAAIQSEQQLSEVPQIDVEGLRRVDPTFANVAELLYALGIFTM